MRIIDVLNLMKLNKIIVVITPNVHEAKLLYDRFKLNEFIKLNSIDKNSFTYEDSKLIITHPRRECPLSKASQIIVEFPDACPKSLFKRLPVDNVEFCEEIV
jgi:hydroxymethylpyrimidine/phosphomethylpyrimidine kinase